MIRSKPEEQTKAAELEEQSGAKPQPGFWEQILVTLKVLLAVGAVLGAIWLLDIAVAN